MDDDIIDLGDILFRSSDKAMAIAQALLADRRDLAALRQDRARLEWFQQEAPLILLVDDKWEINWNISDDGSQQASGPTLRAAIDAAMAPAQAKEQP